MMPYNDYMDEASLFLSHFSPEASSFAEFQREAVSYSSLESVRNNMPATGHTSGEFIRGLRVCYGLTDWQIKLYYVPVYGDVEDTDEETVNFSFSETTGDLPTIINLNTFPVYENISGDLTNIMNDNTAKANAIQSVSDYRANIRIILQDNESPSEYENGRDGKSIFFPFQEIDALHSEYDAETIYFTSAAKVAPSDYKHFIVLSHLDPRDYLSFGGVAANLGRLCPPHCPSATYPIS